MPIADKGEKKVLETIIVVLVLMSLALVVALDCVATVRMVQSDVYTQPQKAAQITIIWLIPMLGSIVVLSVLKATQPPRGYASDVEFPDARFTPSGSSKVEPWGQSSSDGAGHHGS